MIPDPKNIQLAITALAVTLAVSLLGSILLAFAGKDIPEPLWGLAGSAIGALGTLISTYTQRTVRVVERKGEETERGNGAE